MKEGRHAKTPYGVTPRDAYDILEKARHQRQKSGCKGLPAAGVEGGEDNYRECSEVSEGDGNALHLLKILLMLFINLCTGIFGCSTWDPGFPG